MRFCTEKPPATQPSTVNEKRRKPEQSVINVCKTVYPKVLMIFVGGLRIQNHSIFDTSKSLLSKLDIVCLLFVRYILFWEQCVLNKFIERKCESKQNSIGVIDVM